MGLWGRPSSKTRSGERERSRGGRGSLLSFLCLPLSLPMSFYSGIGQAGGGELPRAACGLSEVGADGERDRTAEYIIS